MGLNIVIKNKIEHPTAYSLSIIGEREKMSIIRVENIEKHFGTVIANKNVSFELEKNKIYVSSQNHGYQVLELPIGMELSHINLNDNSVEGMKNKELIDIILDEQQRTEKIGFGIYYSNYKLLLRWEKISGIEQRVPESDRYFWRDFNY